MDMTDPVAVFNAAADAFRRGDYAAVAGMCDPASLMRCKREITARFTSRRQITVEDLLRHDPDMPREAAEYEVARALKASDPDRDLADEFPGVSSVDDLLGMSPGEMYAAWLRGQSLEHQMERAWTYARLTDAQREHARQEIQQANRKDLWPPVVPVGAVEHGAVCYLVYHYGGAPEEGSPEVDEYMASLTPEEQALERDAGSFPQIQQLRRQQDGSWKLICSLGGILGLGGGVFHIQSAETDTTTNPDT